MEPHLWVLEALSNIQELLSLCRAQCNQCKDPACSAVICRQFSFGVSESSKASEHEAASCLDCGHATTSKITVDLTMWDVKETHSAKKTGVESVFRRGSKAPYFPAACSSWERQPRPAVPEMKCTYVCLTMQPRKQSIMIEKIIFNCQHIGTSFYFFYKTHGMP